MDKNKIIMIISITLTVLIIAIVGILIFNKNNQTLKTSATNQEILAEGDKVVEKTTNIDVEESIESSESPSPSPTPTTSPTPIVPVGKYYIKVNNQMNTVTVYTKDSNGQYTVPVRAMICSTGQATPQNSKYQTKNKWRWRLMLTPVYAQYATWITGEILFHSVPYFKANPATLEWMLYDQLGTTCSAGCVRLTTIDAKWIYDNCPIGTTVEFYNSSNPGPLGKPSAMKISGYSAELRNWDPTDPNPNNPWLTSGVLNPAPTPSPSPEASVEPTPSVEPSIASTPSVAPETSTPTNSDKPSQVPTVVTTPSQTANNTPSSNPISIVTDTPSVEPTE